MPAISQGLTCHELLGVVHDGAEEAREGELQVVVQVVLEVDGQVVLQRVDGVLRLVIRLHSLGSLHPEQILCQELTLHSNTQKILMYYPLPLCRLIFSHQWDVCHVVCASFIERKPQ